MPWTLNDTSLLDAPQCSFPKQYINLPSCLASNEWSPLDTDFSMTSYWPWGFVIWCCGGLD